MIDEAELRRMSPDERRQLAHALAAIDLPHPLHDPDLRRRKQLGLLTMGALCIALAAWIVVLVFRLPQHFTAEHWRGVWVGLDIGELAAIAATLWASWHERQVVILFMIVTGTLLLCDAWFDLSLEFGTSGFTGALLSAIFAELPLAILMFTGARRLVRVTVGSLMRLEGLTGPVPPLWRVPLFADGLEEALPSRMRSRSLG